MPHGLNSHKDDDATPAGGTPVPLTLVTFRRKESVKFCNVKAVFAKKSPTLACKRKSYATQAELLWWGSERKGHGTIKSCKRM